MMNSFEQWWSIHSKGVNPFAVWTTQQLKDGMELAWNASLDSSKSKPTLICSRCGVDRLAKPCPTNSLDCKIAGNTK